MVVSVTPPSRPPGGVKRHARGHTRDTWARAGTIFDGIAGLDRLELCHGYPIAHEASAPRISLFSPERGVGSQAVPRRIYRGATRATGETHVYTVSLDVDAPGLVVEHVLNADLRADIYVDGVKEVSHAKLDASRGFGETIYLASDHQGKWPLRGTFREFAMFSGKLPLAFRVAIEAALARKHGVRPRSGSNVDLASDPSDGDDDDREDDESLDESDEDQDEDAIAEWA